MITDKEKKLSNMPQGINQKDGREMWYYEERHGFTICGDGIPLTGHIEILESMPDDFEVIADIGGVTELVRDVYENCGQCIIETENEP